MDNPIRVCQYIRFMERNGNYIDGFSFQNFFADQERTYQDTDYAFAPFLFSGSLGGSTGEGAEANILGTVNQLVVNVFSEVVDRMWLVEIKRVAVIYDEDEKVFEEGATIASEIWDCTAMPRDKDRVVIRLNDPFDAVQTQAPRRRLTASLVGSLPSTGNIRLQ